MAPTTREGWAGRHTTMRYSVQIARDETGQYAHRARAPSRSPRFHAGGRRSGCRQIAVEPIADSDQTTPRGRLRFVSGAGTSILMLVPRRCPPPASARENMQRNRQMHGRQPWLRVHRAAWLRRFDRIDRDRKIAFCSWCWATRRPSVASLFAARVVDLINHHTTAQINGLLGNALRT
jgi:hypothetical protein